MFKRSFAVLAVDVALIALSTVVALLLRDNLVVSLARVQGILPYLGMTVLAALIVLPLLGITRSVWRFSAMTDYLHMLAAVMLIVGVAVGCGFAFNRMDAVPRSLPILQAILMLTALVGARVASRLRHGARSRPVQFSPHAQPGTETVLIVGLGRLTDLFLASIAEFSEGRISIAGILASKSRHTGKLIHRYPVLGTPDEIASILSNLEIHGVLVDRVVVAMPFANLSDAARRALREIETGENVRVDYLAESLGLSARDGADAPLGDGEAESSSIPAAQVFVLPPAELVRMARRPYWRLKRAVDVAVATALLILLAPLIAAVAVIVMLDFGRPVTFSQRRPGLGGVPFRLVKFRTMGAPHDAAGNRILDADRSSAVGRFLRRTRLDELPQLVNVLVGDMSFIGPRPLLPVDQPAEYAARLLVRPGLTGWAQVVGGRTISAHDKAALDVWYIREASLGLDLRILFMTAWTILVGEKLAPTTIERAWGDLRSAGLVRSAAPGDRPSDDGGSGAVASIRAA